MSLFEYIDVMKQPYEIFYIEAKGTPLHWHYYSEIIYIHSGTVDIECNNQTTTLKQGDLCYFYPLQLHSISKNKDHDEPVMHSVIKFNIPTLNIPQAYLQPIYDSFVNRSAEDDYCLILHDAKAIEPLINNIVHEYNSDEWMHMLTVQSNIHNLLVQIARNLSLNKASAPKPSEHNLSFYHILEYIDAHSSEALEISELAAKCNLSYSHFAKLFRENYGRSCSEYIQYIRLNKAQDLLLNSDFDLDYIAQETGFYDCSYFIKQYKKWKGITPKQERLHKNGNKI